MEQNASERSGNIVSTEEKRLTLAYEDLGAVPENLLTDYAPIIEILDLSHNQVSCVSFLIHFTNLSTLILDHNFITEDTVFPHSLKMGTLWLNHNQIKTLHPFIPQLSCSYPNLQCLSLMGNHAAPSYLNGGTYYQYLQCRLFVISWLQELQYLDDRQVTKDQRQESSRLYGRKILRSLRHSFAQYNPTAFLAQIRQLFSKSYHPPPPLATSPTAFGFNIDEGVRLEERQIGGIMQSDSSSSSLNTLMDTLYSNPNANLYRDKRNVQEKQRNLVI